MSAKKKNNPSVYDRTAKGHYPVASTETVKLYGFNIAGGTAKIGSANAVNIGKATVDAETNETTYEAETDDKGAKYYALAVSTFDSGKLDVTVNSVKSINNTNSDTAAYNSQSNGDNNLNLLDDVELDIWAFNNKAVRSYSTGYAKEGIMRVNPTNGTLGFAFASGTDRLAMANGSTNSYDIWQRNYADYSGIDFAYDAGGKTHGIGIGLDTQPSSGIAGRMSYITSKWGPQDEKEQDNFDYQNNFRIESVGLPNNVYLGVDKSTGTRIIDIERFSSISIAAARGANNTNPTIYLAYYDRLNNQVRFRYGTNDLADNSGGNKTRANSTAPKTSFGQFADNWGYAEAGGNNTYYLGTGHGNSNSYDDHKVFESHPKYYSLIAGRSYTKTGADDETTNLAAGPYVSLDVKAGTNEAGDIVPIVWYDGEDLWYTCRYGTKDDTANNSNGITDKWIKPVRVMEGAGEYCVVKIDAGGGIHIAGYDPVDADIRYAYLPSYTATDKVSSCVVDSLNIVGTQISMDVVKVGSNYVPYISYFYPSLNKSKMAYLDNFGWLSKTNLQVPSGSEDDVYTGDWEITIVPSTSTKILDDNTSIGFYKNADTTAKAYAAVDGYSFTATGGAGEGKLVGLAGKTTPVIAYAVEAVPNGYIEIAQKK